MYFGTIIQAPVAMISPLNIKLTQRSMSGTNGWTLNMEIKVKNYNHSFKYRE